MMARGIPFALRIAGHIKRPRRATPCVWLVEGQRVTIGMQIGGLVCTLQYKSGEPTMRQPVDSEIRHDGYDLGVLDTAPHSKLDFTKTEGAQRARCPAGPLTRYGVLRDETESFLS